MSGITLQQAITPSRAAVLSATSSSRSTPAKGKKHLKLDEFDADGNVKLPDYVSPPPKDSREKREWDRMSSRMEGFHSYFRMAFKQLFELSDGSFEKRGLSVREFMSVASDFLHHLTFHHGIEEQHIFPVLAQRMPQFRIEHQEEHDAIHDGMSKLESLISRVTSDPSTYSPKEFQENLASWGPLLFYHLDAEVKTLKSDVLRRYYTLEEVKRLPM
ncbi:hypothetical protein JCM10212_006560 [Sporobolomyces blumeae]